MFSEVELGEPEPGNNNVKNYHDTLPESQVLLSATTRSSTNKPKDSPVVLVEQGNGGNCAEIGFRQSSKFIPLTNEEEEIKGC